MVSVCAAAEAVLVLVLGCSHDACTTTLGSKLLLGAGGGGAGVVCWGRALGQGVGVVLVCSSVSPGLKDVQLLVHCKQVVGCSAHDSGVRQYLSVVSSRKCELCQMTTLTVQFSYASCSCLYNATLLVRL
jgi:hypothetical protein